MAQLDYAPGSEQMTDFTPIPPGEYEAMVTDSDVVATKTGNGQMLKLTWRIVAGEYENRLVFDRININNPNQKAVEIGRKQLNTICRAVGLTHVGDSSELHDRPCLIKVSIRPADGQYPASNEVKFYQSLETQAAAPARGVAAPAASSPAAAPAAASRQPVAAGAGGKPPWARK